VNGRDVHGFTLLEVLVAMFIMALILTFSFQAYQGIAQAYERVSTSTSRDRAARILLDRLERELVGTVLIQREPDTDPLLHPYFFFAQPKMYADAEGDELRFITQTPLRSPGSSPEALALVTYGTTPSQTGPGLALLRQEEIVPAQLAKEILWAEPQVVADNVAIFVARFGGADGNSLESWDSTGVELLDQLPTSIVLSVALWETDANGEPVQSEEFMRVVNLPVRPFRLSPEITDPNAEGDADCGEGTTVEACLETYAEEIADASPALAQAIADARGQVQDQCWNEAQPSSALQRLKVLMGGIPGFDASECQ
jgi:prepilin-type N-terminal cleavage/methylation domain-containing protein